MSVVDLEKLSKYTTCTSILGMNYAANVSLKHKYVYIETPKVACSTIKLTLQRLELGDDTFNPSFDDVHDRSFSPLLSLHSISEFEEVLEGDDYFRFCFARNPYVRTLSAYLDKVNQPKYQKLIAPALGHKKCFEGGHISFKEFISVIEKQSALEMDVHWRHQYCLTCQDTINYHFIGRFESFHDDFVYVMNKLGASSYYKRESSHETGSSSLLSQYYTDDLIERVYHLFQQDFDTFNYSIEIPL